MQDKQFNEDLNETKRNPLLLFKRMCKDFLGNHKATYYEDVVQDLLTSLKTMGCNLSLKIHFLESHLDFSPRKSWWNQWWTRQKISPRLYDYGKKVPRQVDLMYVGRLLLDNGGRCTWCQISVKVHTALHFRGKFLWVSWASKVLFCTLKFPCIFETLSDRKILYTYLNSA